VTSAIFEQAAGRTADTEAMLRSLLKPHVRFFGPDHPNTLNVQRYLAGALRRLGRDTEAEDLYRATLDTWERVAGAPSEYGVDLRRDLISLLCQQNRHDEDEVVPLQQQVLTFVGRDFGPRHTKTAIERAGWPTCSARRAVRKRRSPPTGWPWPTRNGSSHATTSGP